MLPMYKKMLVPLDGSELAEVVFTYAKELAGRLDLSLVLLHVCSPAAQEFAPMHQKYIERAADIVERQSRDVQEQTGIKRGGKPVEARGVLVIGHPAAEILNYSEKNNIDIILMATHGHSGVRRWALGGVADKVLRASKVPVWLVRAGIPDEIVYEKWPERTMLVPLDGSKISESVLPHVEALAKQHGAELVDVILLRVCDVPIVSSEYPSDMPLSWEEHVRRITEYRKHLAERYLAGVEKQLEGNGLKVQYEVLTGDPAEQIINHANKNPFNLIVMSTYGRSGVQWWTWGSVAEKVLQGTSSPIFLVRPG